MRSSATRASAAAAALLLGALGVACSGSGGSPGAGGTHGGLAGTGCCTGGGGAGATGGGGTGTNGGAAGTGCCTGGGGAGPTGGGGAGASGGGGAAGAPGLFDCSEPSGGVTIKLTLVADGFDRPLVAESPPLEGSRVLVGEQPGVVTIIDHGQKLPAPFLDIRDRVESGGNEQGLLGMAFHPDHAHNGKLYVHYTANGTTAPDGDTMVAEFRVSPNDPNTVDLATEKAILTVSQPETNHNGGDLHFGADGMLYLGLGDGGGGGDQHGPIGNGQARDTLLGKLLRIDVDHPSGGRNYGIPSGNMTGTGVRPELWAHGLRNPWRWAFDPCTGDKYIGDVGQDAVEEIDVEPAARGSGTNYGWRIMEGSQCYDPPTGCPEAGLTLPVASYTHDDGCAVVGGYVYRGSAIPGLRGTYLYADYCRSRFWSFVYAGGAATAGQELTDELTLGGTLPVGPVTSFGQDAEGELYVTDLNGVLWRIDPG
jgi:glucose/arabinose dehydrogenase